MKYLHENGIIHRDLKLDNILLDGEKKPKVVDFGFSKCLEKTKVNISDSIEAYKGTPLYSSPEILLENKYTKAGDVYAFGMIAYIIFSNEIPFKDSTLDALKLKMANGSRPNLKFVLNDACKTLIEHCWDQDDSKRPTFDEIVDELENNRDFITDDMDEGQFLDYVDMIKDYPISFDDGEPIISIDDYSELIEQKKKEKAREHFILAKNFFNGNDTPVNKQKAAENCKEAAELGDDEAIFNYALMLHKGDGVTKNTQQADIYINIAYQKDADLKFQNFYEDDKESNEWINEFKFTKYIEPKKELYEHVLEFVEDNIDYKTLTDFLDKLNLDENKEEFKLFFKIIINIANNHHRHPNLMSNIEQIISYYQDKMKTIFSNYEIFEIFKPNKLIVLFLFEHNIIKMDKRIYIDLIDIKEPNGIRYCNFFFPEIKRFFNKEKIKYIDIEALEKENNHIVNFDEKRHIGENDSYLCLLIRQDRVDEFDVYTIQENIQLMSKIKPSIFETNAFLNENNPTLIEYAAFFGSIKIIKYLLAKNVELTPSLLLYLVHSQNLDFINFLLANKTKPSKSNYAELHDESIKCHHNCIAEYIKSNFIASGIEKSENEVFNVFLQYQNYSYFSYEMMNESNFFKLCYYGYYEIVNFYIKIRDEEIKKTMNTHIYTQMF